MSDITCPFDGGELKLDWEETRNNGVMMVFLCDKCGRGYILQQISEKPMGWKTKNLLDNNKLINSIPF